MRLTWRDRSLEGLPDGIHSEKGLESGIKTAPRYSLKLAAALFGSGRCSEAWRGRRW